MSPGVPNQSGLTNDFQHRLTGNNSATQNLQTNDDDVVSICYLFVCLCYLCLFLMFVSVCQGRHPLKKTVFFRRKSERGGGGLAESKISVNRKKFRIFWIFCQKGGGLTQSKISVSRKMRFLGIFCQKEGILSEKTQNFLELGGGSPPIQNFC